MRQTTNILFIITGGYGELYRDSRTALNRLCPEAHVTVVTPQQAGQLYRDGCFDVLTVPMPQEGRTETETKALEAFSENKELPLDIPVFLFHDGMPISIRDSLLMFRRLRCRSMITPEQINRDHRLVNGLREQINRYKERRSDARVSQAGTSPSRQVMDLNVIPFPVPFVR